MPVNGAADLDAIEEFLALLGAFLLDELAAGEDDVLAVVVDLDDLEVVGVAHELLEIFRGNDVDLGSGKEGFDADIDGKTAFDDGFDLALDEAIAMEDLDDLVPVLFVGGFLLRELDHALVVLEALEEDFDFVADLKVLHVVELGGWDDALGLVADVHEDFAGTDFKDMAFYDAAFAKVLETLRDELLHFNHWITLRYTPRVAGFSTPGLAMARAYRKGKGI